MKRLDSKIGWLGCLLAVFLLGSVDMMAQPANDECDGTVTVTDVVADGTVYSVSGDGTGATDGLGAGASHVWEAFTTTECSTVSIAFCNSENPPTNVFISVTDCPVTGATNGVTETCNVEDFIVVWEFLPAGTWYYPVMADATFGGDAPYTIEISAEANCPPEPTNSICDDAIAISEGIFTDMILAGSNGASNMCFDTDPATSAVWYEYTASISGEATISSSIDLDQPDTRVSVYTGACDALVCLASDDDGGEGFTSITTFPVTAGESYLVEWDDRWGTDEFDFEVSVESLLDDCPDPTAIICDNADEYILGPMNGQGAHWGTWSGTLGGAEDAIVSDEQAFSNTQSVLVAEGQTQDPILLLGNQTTGTWDISWMEYIPTDATAYYNLQEDETPGVAWNLDVFFNQGGTDPGNGVVTTTGSTFAYPQDEWFPVSMSLDLDNDLITVSINGVDVDVDAAYTGNLGSVNFFSIDATNRFYLDDVIFDGDDGTIPDPCPAPDAIICDNVDDYDLGPMNGQGAWWSTWGGALGGADDGIVTNEQAFSNDQSVLIAEGQTQDVILLLGNQTEGTFELSWMEYVPTDATAYFNLQEDEVPGVAWNLDVFFNQGGTDPGNGVVTTTGSTFAYPQDEWFPVSMSIDLDNDLISVSINGVDVDVDAAYTGNLGSVNFFSIDATNRYYLDDVIYDGDALVECPAPDAIICDNIDDYELGPMNGQGPWWSTWGGTVGGADDGIVTDEQAFSNGQSVLIAEGQTQDVIFLLGNQTGGTFELSWMEYVPTDATAYYNLQEDEVPGVAWNLDVFFNQGGTDPGNGVITTTGSTFTYPQDEWFPVQMSIDLDNDLISVSIAGADVDVDAAYAGNLGSVNFFSIDATNRYYLDDIIFDGEGVVPCPAPDAIICDNLDDYELGPTNGQGAHWSTWGGTVGGADDGIVTDEQAFSNSQSVLIAEGQTQDVILLLGNQTAGVWDISWMEYVPADATAYYNIQEDEVPGVAWNLDVFFNQGGTDPGNGVVTTTGSTFTYPEDQWFSVEMHLDLNNDVITVTIDGVVVDDEAAFAGNLGSINFFSIDATNRYYLDDVVFDGDAEVGIIEYTESAFTVYPNPTESMLTIAGDQQIDAVVLRDMLGAVVRQINSPFSNQVTLDIANLTNGVYFVEVRVGDVVNVSRVIKQ